MASFLKGLAKHINPAPTRKRSGSGGGGPSASITTKTTKDGTVTTTSVSAAGGGSLGEQLAVVAAAFVLERADGYLRKVGSVGGVPKRYS